MTAPYSISVQKQETDHYVDGRTQGYRVILTITITAGFVDAGLFRLRQINGQQSFFEGICSPSDLQDWLLDQPDETEGVFRSHVADLVFPAKQVALDTTTLILSELKILCREMAKLATDLAAPTTIPVTSDDA